MKALSKKKLELLGFKRHSWHEYFSKSLYIEKIPGQKTMEVFVFPENSNRFTAQKCLGVKNENDIIKLTELINGKPITSPPIHQ